MQIIKTNEYDIDERLSKQISELLTEAFQDVYPCDRIYYKQIPHFRFLAFDKDLLIGHVSLDYRVMNLNGKPINVLGIIDFAVRREYRGKNMGMSLLQEIEKFSKGRNIDFLLLFTEIEAYYERYGFVRVKNICRWMKINDHTTLGIGEELVEGLMIKSVGSKVWEEGPLDMLGYLY